MFELLDKHHVTYEKDSLITCFDVYEDTDAYAQMLPLIKKHHCPDIDDTVFSDQEMDSAAWYAIRCKWRYGYPMPDNDNSYLGITYGLPAPYNSCRCRAEQCTPFQIKSEPRWGSRSFLMLNWIEDELFVSNSCAAILSKSGLKGFEFWPVKSKNGQQTLQNIKQLKIQTIAPAGLYSEPFQTEQIGICRSCQAPIHLLKAQQLRFNETSLQAVQGDIAKTTELFGAVYGRRKLLISRRFYDVIVRNKLGKNLKIEPILTK